jgi:hypothetical protein
MRHSQRRGPAAVPGRQHCCPRCRALFEGDEIAHEHLYWDQASVLVQIGLVDRTLPVRGGEIAAQVLNPDSTDERAHPSRAE